MVTPGEANGFLRVGAHHRGERCEVAFGQRGFRGHRVSVSLPPRAGRRRCLTGSEVQCILRIRTFRNHCGLIKSARSGFLGRKPRKASWLRSTPMAKPLAPIICRINPLRGAWRRVSGGLVEGNWCCCAEVGRGASGYWVVECGSDAGQHRGGAGGSTCEDNSRSALAPERDAETSGLSQ